MKFTTFLHDGSPRLGVVDGDSVIDLNAVQPQVPASLRGALEAGVDLPAAADAALGSNGERIALASLEFAPLIPEPGKVICLGLNYFDHAKEGGRDKPEYPWFFYRGKTSLVAHGKPGRVPKISERFDYEAELGVIIGRQVPRHVSQEAALQYVAGYTCFNDMSVRDYQKRTPQWTIGKNFDATGGFGPVMVTADELPQGAVGLNIQCRLNGEVMQNADTADMIWSVAETITLLSQCMTLEPGDVIAMGTPAGVGQARTPQLWMKHGDTVEIEIEGIGTLRNPILGEEA
ncbi:Fumarylacetoacetate hydrolase family protein [Marinobacterium lacunae]|uniref:Fumarylacetoacetate hydrolase family protein n=1 Tax=Marinobacterium lacunae TaxID=1232683 RepID=A0A081FX25_9GAMM|nr:fumarylacetoacetate hydrolase family protein [Marinobacterium lacunae]KEA63080.1 Fumarylacetoacetate hydrolase family protein [Marinobacterium lacunae]